MAVKVATPRLLRYSIPLLGLTAAVSLALSLQRLVAVLTVAKRTEASHWQLFAAVFPIWLLSIASGAAVVGLLRRRTWGRPMVLGFLILTAYPTIAFASPSRMLVFVAAGCWFVASVASWWYLYRKSSVSAYFATIGSRGVSLEVGGAQHAAIPKVEPGVDWTSVDQEVGQPRWFTWLTRRRDVVTIVALAGIVIGAAEFFDAAESLGQRASGLASVLFPAQVLTDVESGVVPPTSIDLLQSGSISVQPGQSFAYHWSAPPGSTACEISVGNRDFSGIELSGESHIFPDHPWYPTPDLPSVFAVTCYAPDSLNASSAHASASGIGIVILGSERGREGAVGSSEERLVAMSFAVLSDEGSIDLSGLATQARDLSSQPLSESQRVRLGILLFQIDRRRGDMGAACRSLMDVIHLGAASEYSRALDRLTLNYCEW